MEKYKGRIRMRANVLAVIAVFTILLRYFESRFVSDALRESAVSGFQGGIASGLRLVSLIGYILYSRMLRDEVKLRKQYNRENDERLKAIRAKAGMPMLMITSVAMFIGGIIAGYFQPVAFVALCVAAACQLLIAATVKVYYMKKI